MSKIYFISDLHLSHNNIIKYCNRPYENTEDMNNDIIKRWNSVVTGNDTVWVLGDVGLGKKEDIKKLLLQLKGHKKLIMGNHDRWSPRTYYECGFEFVSQYPVLLKGHFLLSHAPIMDCGPFYNIYGHVHANPEFQTETERSRCVCFARQDYTPIRLPVFDSYVEVKDDF